ncbi:MAG: efflux RND transporter permease subunit [Rhodospirillales bacterium]
MLTFFKFIAHNRHFSAMVALVIVIYGALALNNATVSRDPDYAIPVVSVTLFLPGASPSEIERTVIYPIEEELRSVADLDRIDSHIEHGNARIRAEFRFGVDISVKRQDMESAINGIRYKLPDELEYSLKAVRVSDFQASYMLALSGDGNDPASAFREARLVEARLQSLPELKSVEILKADEEIAIVVNLEKVRQLGISLSHISSEIESANTNLPGRRVTVDDRYYRLLPPESSLDAAIDLDSILLRSESSIAWRLSDVAKIERTPEEQPVLVRADGEPVTLIKATANPDINIFQVNAKLKDTLSTLEQRLPNDVKLDVVYDQSQEVWRLIKGLIDSFILTIVVLFVVFYFTVEARSTLIILALLPLSFLASMSVLSFTDYGVQQVSMAGFIIALGMIVDNGIVVTENSFLNERYGKMSRSDAAVQGAGSAFSPLLSSTLTTMVAFAPIFFLTSPSGLYLRSLSATIWINLLCSLFVACTVIVLLLAAFGTMDRVRWLPAPKSLLTRLIPFRDRQFRNILAWAIKYRLLVIGIFIAAFIGTGFVARGIPVKLMPPSDDPYLTVNVTLPTDAGASLREHALREIETVLRAHEGVENVLSFSGIAAPTVNVGMDATGDPVFLVRVDSPVESRLLELRDRISDSLDPLRVLGAISISPFDPARAGPRKSDFSLIISGPDHADLADYAHDIRDRLPADPNMIRMYNPAELEDISVIVELDPELMAAHGVTRSEVAPVLRMLSFGQEVGHLRDQKGDETPIRLKVARPPEAPFIPVDGVIVSRDDGSHLALSDITKTRLDRTRTKIDHLDFRPVVEVEFWLKSGAKVGEFSQRVLETVSDRALPPGADIRLGGMLQTRTQDFQDLGKFASFSALIIFSIFVLQFRSFTQPLIVFSAIPFCAIGALLAIAVSGQYMSFIAALGLASLMGIVVNDSILLVDEANELAKAEPETPVADLAVAAAVKRFMPVVLTSLTTTLGLLPVAMGESPFKGMATVIAGGLASSTLLILVLVPVLYSLLTRR